MPKTENTSQKFLKFLVLSLTLISLSLGTIFSPPKSDQFIPFLILILFVLVLELFSLDLFNYKYSLLHIVVFSGGILFGSGIASWSCFFGIGIATGLQRLFPNFGSQSSSLNKSNPFTGIFDLGLVLIPLIISLPVFRLAGGISTVDLTSNDYLIWILASGLLFGSLHGFLYYWGVSFLTAKQSNHSRWDFLALISIEILPVFFGFTTLLFFPFLSEGSLIVLGVSTFAITLVIQYLSAPRRNLERRLQELSALEEISKALSADIELQKLLSAIQVQVTNLLNVNNFYVALLDPFDSHIWYPLAVKNGKRQNWPRRSLTDRLTDRVILESKSILISRRAAQQLTKIGLPSGEDAPYAWIGVPLIASEQTIGCLALFSLTSEVEFTEDDLNLLTILSGQTSVAIEIALHNALLSSEFTIGRDRLTTILNSVRDGLLLISSEGRISMVNEAVTQLTGFPQSDFLGQSLDELPPEIIKALGFIDQESVTLFINPQDSVEKNLKKYAYAIEDHPSDMVLERSLILVDEASDRKKGLLILLRDITDEYKLKEAQNLISETLVHDLRSPLSSTISALDVIHDSYIAGDPANIVEPSIQIAQRSSRRLLAMVESILEISRMESGNIELSFSNVNIESLIVDCVTEFSPLAAEYGVSIKFALPAELPRVQMDKQKIHRVLNNLIDNALKFSPANGEVLLDSGLKGGETLEIRVIDSGPGIPVEYRKRIFERFAQIPGRSSRKRGSGLGLTYCRLAIEAHAGQIWVEDNPSGGSVFIINLPILGPGK